MRRLASRPAAASETPSSWILPASGSMYWMIMRIVVDLPAPFGPRKPTTSPRLMVNDASSTATTPSNRLETPWSVSSDVASGGAVMRSRVVVGGIC